MPAFPFRTRFIAAAAGLGVIALAGYRYADAQGSVVNKPAEAAASAPQADGPLRVPAGYRTTYEFLGTWAVAADDGKGAKQMHVVYASPGTIASFQKSGHFPDGTVLVKEVFDAASKPMTTGSVSHQEKLEGWFVMVRDTRTDHAGSKLWGYGWGWAWFDAADPVKTTSTDYRTNCQGCHVPARATDWIYTFGYPALKQ